MLVVRQQSPDYLVVGTGRVEEMLGLFFCGASLLALSTMAIFMYDPGELKIPGIFLAQFAYYPMTFLAAGVLMVFMQRRFIFYRERQEIHFKQGIQRNVVYRFRDIASVEVQKGANGQAAAQFVFNTGKIVVITRGKIAEIQKLADRINEFLKLQATLDVPQATPVSDEMKKPQADRIEGQNQ